MKNINLDNVEEAKEYKVLPAGGYICRIVLVEDVPDREYLKMEYDIDEGEFKGHYQALFANRGFWAGKFVKSYKETALPFFKSFTTAVEASNKGYKWNSDETTLIDKVVGLVLAEEEYWGNDGSLKTRLYVHQTRSIQSIKDNDYKVPAKKLKTDKPKAIVEADPAGFNAFSTDIADDDKAF